MRMYNTSPSPRTRSDTSVGLSYSCTTLSKPGIPNATMTHDSWGYHQIMSHYNPNSSVHLSVKEWELCRTTNSPCRGVLVGRAALLLGVCVALPQANVLKLTATTDRVSEQNVQKI